ncbi:MAG: NUDIX domain-containing protein [Anaerolineae bacterium]|nr:NUDIX domain-containing protein [Anaerolineae bacterium]
MEIVGEGALLLLETADGRIAVQLRDDAKYTGYWGLFGGWKKDGEKPEEAAVREAWEELSITLDPAKLAHLITRVSENRIRAYVYYYPITDELEHAELHEGTDFQMMSSQELMSQDRVVPFHIEILNWYWSRETPSP